MLIVIKYPYNVNKNTTFHCIINVQYANNLKGACVNREYVGSVIALFISKKDAENRTSVEEISCKKEGIVKDKFFDKDRNRSILITSTKSYRMLENENIEIDYGQLGENILIDYNPYHLAPGSILYIGNTQLEITLNCTLCNHLSFIDKRIPRLLKRDRGIFAKVIKEGSIKQKDTVSIRYNREIVK